MCTPNPNIKLPNPLMECTERERSSTQRRFCAAVHVKSLQAFVIEQIRSFCLINIAFYIQLYKFICAFYEISSGMYVNSINTG